LKKRCLYVFTADAPQKPKKSQEFYNNMVIISIFKNSNFRFGESPCARQIQLPESTESVDDNIYFVRSVHQIPACNIIPDLYNNNYYIIYLHSTHPMCGIIIWNNNLPNHCIDDRRRTNGKDQNYVYIIILYLISRCYNNNTIIIIITFQRCHYVIRTRYRRYFWTDTMCGSPPTVYFGEGADSQTGIASKGVVRVYNIIRHIIS